MKRSFHDLSVLFDDDGKVYVVWGYQEIHFAQLDDELTDIVPGTERVLIAKPRAWARARTSTRSTASTSSPAPGTRDGCGCRARAPTGRRARTR